MAKQIGPYKMAGRTIDDLVFYQMDGENYVRVKSSLTGKRVKTKPEFRRTMYYAGLMSQASKIGSLIYKALPENWRKFWMYRAFTGEALKMLKAGKEKEEIVSELRRVYVDHWEQKKQQELIASETPVKSEKPAREILLNYVVNGKKSVCRSGVCTTPANHLTNKSFIGLEQIQYNFVKWVVSNKIPQATESTNFASDCSPPDCMAVSETSTESDSCSSSSILS